MKLIMCAILTLCSHVFADVCIQSRFVRNWTLDGREALILDAGRNTYRMVVNICPELPWANHIAFKTFIEDRVCIHDKLLILDAAGTYIKSSCQIRSIQKI